MIPLTTKFPSSKFQVPSSKFQVPSSKFQVPSSNQPTNINNMSFSTSVEPMTMHAFDDQSRQLYRLCRPPPPARH
ncbi:unnamed protein product [Ambrosiozyma monospora]|uniref:Unnamed protein product n=1 Tax=Ambrosiozyma monospora TaxID=43982 RepID=A0A9W6Z5H6_AMBMO|nr:unnamed protein product [Ambrosiozyma monospora]